ncbi:MAG: TonB-dependent receptor [Methylomonas sp.]|nr:TonB-dependent receptor [Methylomonas sp.]PPD22929.1 MAG: TonB-dependent receptor [Methylomonas sp.]PPD26463.1 MAG: TonB-dependent receptor [Methylomonas sp.]PPD38231.1 MAG: TonB-dependent receptor [Methylomonas sp.]PPD41948.1 MAG: TonB-dependent receptor [Methylomonas sp.]
MEKPRHISLKPLILMVFCLNALAQADHDLDDLMELSPAELADISVSIASGTRKKLSQSAAVTSVITAEQIAAMGATDLHEVLITVPGIHATIQPVTNDISYSVRGMRNDSNAQVLMMLNGTRFTLPYQGTHMVGMTLPVEAIQRIEVIRGPGSALYGADAFAGVINIVTKKAGDIDGTTLGARGGNHDSKTSWGQYGGHWQGWNVAASLQYSRQGLEPDRIIASDAQTAFDTQFGTRASLAPGPMQTQQTRWNAHLDLQRKHWNLGFWVYDNDSGMRAGGAGALDDRGFLQGRQYLGDLRHSTEDDIDNLEIQTHVSFLHADATSDVTGFPRGARLPIDGRGNVVTSALTPVAGIVGFPEGMRFDAGFTNTVPSVELTGIYKGLSDHIVRLTSGFRYEQLHTREARNFGVGVLNPLQGSAGAMQNLTGTPLTFLADQSRAVWSLAAQDEWQFAQRWHLTTGLRFDHYSDFGATLNPRAALVWDIHDELTAKLLYGQAFRAPSFLELHQRNSPFFNGTPTLRPETIETTELAFDYHPGQRLRTALNLFYYQIRDLIGGELGVTPGALTSSNMKGQQGYGGELEWDWRFVDDWSLRGNYAWQHADNLTTNYRVTGVPEHQIYTAVAWQFLPKWQIQSQVNWIGTRLTSPNDPRGNLPGYETIDITLNAQRLMGHLDLTASVRNLLDSRGREPGILTYTHNLPINTQTFYFEASVHF